MVERGWRAHCLGDTAFDTFTNSVDEINHFYKDNTIVDQLMLPFVIPNERGQPAAATSSVFVGRLARTVSKPCH